MKENISIEYLERGVGEVKWLKKKQHNIQKPPDF